MICLTFSSTAIRGSPRDFKNLEISPGARLLPPLA